MVKFKNLDGSVVDFDVNRIIQKIMASQEAVGLSSFDEALTTAMTVQGRFLHSQEVTGRDINHFTEHLLMGTNRDVARAFIEERVEGEHVRNVNAISGYMESNNGSSN